MKTFLVLVFYLLVVDQDGIGAEVANIGSDQEGMEWRKEILKGISVLPKLGQPGRIVVYGKNAEPILTGRNEEDILVAAAEFGKGRIVVISDVSYTDKFLENDNSTGDTITKFHRNLKQWLTRGTYEEQKSIISAGDSVSKEQLKSSKIVILQDDNTKIPLKDMTEYVRNGGGLLYTMIPWLWLYFHEGKTLSDVSYLKLLGEAGIYYSDQSLNASDDGLFIKYNKAPDGHLLRVLKYVGTNIEKAAEKISILKGLKYLPKEEILPLSSTITEIMDGFTEEIKKRIIPSPTHIVSNKTDKAILDIWLLFYNKLQPLSTKAPGVNLFPGDFPTEPELKTHTVEIHSNLQDFHSTGCYLPAGQTLRVEVLSGNEGHDWELMIGCHTDELGNDDWRRWPKVNTKVKLAKKKFELSTPFGGLIYLISPEKTNRSISVKLENVVDSPRFRLYEKEQGKETWVQSRNSLGLWADIEGELVTITLPASSVREMDFDALTSVMKIWDSVVRLCHDLRGTDVSKFRRQWFVTDEQPSAGYMHAGYPIVTHLDIADPKVNYFFLNGTELLRDGNWGPFHEIGHNLQRDEWTFEDTLEITANIFSICILDTICHVRPLIHPRYQEHLRSVESFFKDDTNPEKWNTSAIYATVYSQLALDFGWESYKKVFRRYEAMNESEKPKDVQMKIDTWFSIFSEVVGFNLSPLVLFWAIPISDETLARLQIALPVAFLPDDVVTRFAPDRVDDILKKFPSIVRTNLGKTRSSGKSDALWLE